MAENEKVNCEGKGGLILPELVILIEVCLSEGSDLPKETWRVSKDTHKRIGKLYTEPHEWK